MRIINDYNKTYMIYEMILYLYQKTKGNIDMIYKNQTKNLDMYLKYTYEMKIIKTTKKMKLINKKINKYRQILTN